MDKTVHASVTECGSTTPSSSEKHASGTIKEVAIDPPAQKPDNPSYAIRRTSAVHRHRRQKPLPLDRFAQAVHRIPRAFKMLLIIILTGIPFMIFMLVARYSLKGIPIGPPALHATYFKLSKWMAICWASLLIIFSLAAGMARLASWVCNFSTHWVKYAPLANTLCFRVTMLSWAGAAHQANCRIWNNEYKGNDDWPATLRQVFVFLVVSFSILLLQGIVLQLIAIRYVEGYIGPRSKQASNELEIIRDLNNLVKKHIEHDDPSFFVKVFKKIFFPVVDDTYSTIVAGAANEAQHREYAATIWNTVAVDMHKDALTAADISSRLREMDRDPEAAEDLFAQLDESCDGQVTREEVETLVVNTGAQLNKRADSMRGIKKLLFKLELLLTCLVFGVIVFVYSNFFNQSWVKDSKALWTGVTGLGFALNGTITEFVNSCVFVFAKHSYDVGDLVEAKSKKMVVRDIHLTHTNFSEIRDGEDENTTGIVVQISHASLVTEVIVNWTRSNDLKIAKKKKQEEDDDCCAKTDEERKGSVSAKFAGW